MCFRSPAEAIAAASLLQISPDKVKERFDYCSGIARYLFIDVNEEIRDSIHHVVSGVDSRFITDVVRSDSRLSQDHYGVGSILVFDSVFPFQERGPYGFSSRFVATEVAAQFEQKLQVSISQILNGDVISLWRLSNIGTELFEGYAARKVFLGGKFQVCFWLCLFEDPVIFLIWFFAFSLTQASSLPKPDNDALLSFTFAPHTGWMKFISQFDELATLPVGSFVRTVKGKELADFIYIDEPAPSSQKKIVRFMNAYYPEPQSSVGEMKARRHSFSKQGAQEAHNALSSDSFDLQFVLCVPDLFFGCMSPFDRGGTSSHVFNRFSMFEMSIALSDSSPAQPTPSAAVAAHDASDMNN